MPHKPRADDADDFPPRTTRGATATNVPVSKFTTQKPLRRENFAPPIQKGLKQSSADPRTRKRPASEALSTTANDGRPEERNGGNNIEKQAPGHQGGRKRSFRESAIENSEPPSESEPSGQRRERRSGEIPESPGRKEKRARRLRGSISEIEGEVNPAFENINGQPENSRSPRGSEEDEELQGDTSGNEATPPARGKKRIISAGRGRAGSGALVGSSTDRGPSDDETAPPPKRGRGRPPKNVAAKLEDSKPAISRRQSVTQPAGKSIEGSAPHRPMRLGRGRSSTQDEGVVLRPLVEPRVKTKMEGRASPPLEREHEVAKEKEESLISPQLAALREYWYEQARPLATVERCLANENKTCNPSQLCRQCQSEYAAFLATISGLPVLGSQMQAKGWQQKEETHFSPERDERDTIKSDLTKETTALPSHATRDLLSDRDLLGLELSPKLIEVFCQRIWESLPLKKCSNPACGIGQRCEQCIRAYGKATSYLPGDTKFRNQLAEVIETNHPTKIRKKLDESVLATEAIELLELHITQMPGTDLAWTFATTAIHLGIPQPDSKLLETVTGSRPGTLSVTPDEITRYHAMMADGNLYGSVVKLPLNIRGEGPGVVLVDETELGRKSTKAQNEALEFDPNWRPVVPNLPAVPWETVRLSAIVEDFRDFAWGFNMDTATVGAIACCLDGLNGLNDDEFEALKLLKAMDLSSLTGRHKMRMAAHKSSE